MEGVYQETFTAWLIVCFNKLSRVLLPTNYSCPSFLTALLPNWSPTLRPFTVLQSSLPSPALIAPPLFSTSYFLTLNTSASDRLVGKNASFWPLASSLSPPGLCRRVLRQLPDWWSYVTATWTWPTCHVSRSSLRGSALTPTPLVSAIPADLR